MTNKSLVPAASDKPQRRPGASLATLDRQLSYILPTQKLISNYGNKSIILLQLGAKINAFSQLQWKQIIGQQYYFSIVHTQANNTGAKKIIDNSSMCLDLCNKTWRFLIELFTICFRLQFIKRPQPEIYEAVQCHKALCVY